MAQTKVELVEELGSSASKAELVELLGSKLRKDDLVSLLEDESGATKDELLRRLGSRKKDELVQAVADNLTKDDLQKIVEDRRDDEDEDEDDGQEQEQERGQEQREQRSEQSRGRQVVHDDSREIDWAAELEWSPPPRPTPAPVMFVGAPPYQPGQRVRVDVSGLPMMGIFAGKGASAAGTIIGVDAQARMVRVYLDAVFDGEKEIVVPPERVLQDG